MKNENKMEKEQKQREKRLLKTAVKALSEICNNHNECISCPALDFCGVNFDAYEDMFI